MPGYLEVCIWSVELFCNLIVLLQEAFDIFGDVGDLLEIYDQRKREEADGAEEEQEPDFSDEEAAETFRAEQVLNKQGQACCSVCTSLIFCVFSLKCKLLLVDCFSTPTQTAEAHSTVLLCMPEDVLRLTSH